MANASTRSAKGELRRSKLDGRELRRGTVLIAVLPPAGRISLRAPADSVPALAQALGVSLSTTPKRSATTGARSALWLGPDEWLVIDRAGRDLLADLAEVRELHSAVGISHRNVGFAVTGADAETALGAGCPQDLSLDTFPVDACSRTVLGKVEIVLRRTGEEAFHVECWRSFSDYVLTFLTEAARDAAE